jgi:Mn-dependent DtxR family transcriptional regulator
MASPSREDYLEAIWILTRDQGFTRVSDIAHRLQLSVGSASKMVRRLAADDLVQYERYRGIRLTALGEAQGRLLAARHAVLERFLACLGVHDLRRVHDTVEGIEHYMDPQALLAIDALVDLATSHPEWWHHFEEHLQNRKIYRQPGTSTT